MLKLKFHYSGQLMRRTDSLKKTLLLGKSEGKKRRAWQRMRWLDGITDLMDMSLSSLQELVMGQRSLMCCSPRGHKELDTTEQLNWTEPLPKKYCEQIPKNNNGGSHLLCLVCAEPLWALIHLILITALLRLIEGKQLAQDYTAKDYTEPVFQARPVADT